MSAHEVDSRGSFVLDKNFSLKCISNRTTFFTYFMCCLELQVEENGHNYINVIHQFLFYFYYRDQRLFTQRLFTCLAIDLYRPYGMCVVAYKYDFESEPVYVG